MFLFNIAPFFFIQFRSYTHDRQEPVITTLVNWFLAITAFWLDQVGANCSKYAIALPFRSRKEGTIADRREGPFSPNNYAKPLII